jgi:hypothetical protein
MDRGKGSPKTIVIVGALIAIVVFVVLFVGIEMG